MTLRLPRETTDDERHMAWKRVVERIYDEQVGHAWRHYVFRLVRAVFAQNQQLSDEGGFIFTWAAENYVDSALMLLRRELDKQASAYPLASGDLYM